MCFHNQPARGYPLRNCRFMADCSSTNKGTAVFSCRLNSLLLLDTELTWDTTESRITFYFCRKALKGPHLAFLGLMGEYPGDSRKMPHRAFCAVGFFSPAKSNKIYYSTFGLKPGFLRSLGIAYPKIRTLRRFYTTSGESDGEEVSWFCE